MIDKELEFKVLSAVDNPGETLRVKSNGDIFLEGIKIGNSEKFKSFVNKFITELEKERQLVDRLTSKLNHLQSWLKNGVQHNGLNSDHCKALLESTIDWKAREK